MDTAEGMVCAEAVEECPPDIHTGGLRTSPLWLGKDMEGFQELDFILEARGSQGRCKGRRETPGCCVDGKLGEIPKPVRRSGKRW